MADQMLNVFQLSTYIDNSVGGWNPESRVNVRLYLAAAHCHAHTYNRHQRSSIRENSCVNEK